MHHRNKKRPLSHGVLAELQGSLGISVVRKTPPRPGPPPENYYPPNSWFENIRIRCKWTAGRKRAVARILRRHERKEIDFSRRKKVLNISLGDALSEHMRLLIQKQKAFEKEHKLWYDGRRGWLYILTGLMLHFYTDTGCL